MCLSDFRPSQGQRRTRPFHIGLGLHFSAFIQKARIRREHIGNHRFTRLDDSTWLDFDTRNPAFYGCGYGIDIMNPCDAFRLDTDQQIALADCFHIYLDRLR